MTDRLRRQCLEVREPATGRLIGTVDTATSDVVQDTVNAARYAQKAWARLSAEARVQSLSHWRSQIMAHGRELATLLSRENGKPLHESLLHEVVALAESIDYITKTAPALQRARSTTPQWFKHRTHLVHRRPRGVVAILSPFNFPLLIPGSDAASALAMGCAVVLKPSPSCPLVANRLVELAHTAGIPADLFRTVQGDETVGQMLISCNVDEVVFTGSAKHGRAVGRQCGERLIACTMELGGNCPLIILDDADLDRAARAIAVGAFTNSGQSCLAVGRVLVPRALSKALVERLTSFIEKLRQGEPVSDNVDLGALTTLAQIERCRSHVEQARHAGAQVITARQFRDRSGNFFAPTLLAECDTDGPAFAEETFGPVLPIACFDDIEQAAELLNRGRTGLTAYVFGGDLERARRVATHLDFAQVVVDQVLLTYVCPELPLAGLRESGVGVVHGEDGLLSHTTPTVLGMPRIRLPTSLEFDWNEPKRARALAEGYLASHSAWKRVFDWCSR